MLLRWSWVLPTIKKSDLGEAKMHVFHGFQYDRKQATPSYFATNVATGHTIIFPMPNATKLHTKTKTLLNEMG